MTGRPLPPDEGARCAGVVLEMLRGKITAEEAQERIRAQPSLPLVQRPERAARTGTEARTARRGG